MKKLSLVFAMLMAFSFVSVAQTVGGPEITFEKDIHDFGKIKQYGNATTEFKFTNTGNAPLIISNCKGSCGCTVPEWPRTPIAPGESAVITVKYDSKRTGPINKSVNVTSNAVNTPSKVLRIKGHINPAPKDATAPNNTNAAPSVQ